MRVKVGQIRFLGSKPGIIRLALVPAASVVCTAWTSFLSNAGRDLGRDDFEAAELVVVLGGEMCAPNAPPWLPAATGLRKRSIMIGSPHTSVRHQEGITNSPFR